MTTTTAKQLTTQLKADPEELLQTCKELEIDASAIPTTRIPEIAERLGLKVNPSQQLTASQPIKSQPQKQLEITEGTLTLAEASKELGLPEAELIELAESVGCNPNALTWGELAELHDLFILSKAQETNQQAVEKVADLEYGITQAEVERAKFKGQVKETALSIVEARQRLITRASMNTQTAEIFQLLDRYTVNHSINQMLVGISEGETSLEEQIQTLTTTENPCTHRRNQTQQRLNFNGLNTKLSSKLNSYKISQES